jgi:protease-4
MVSLSSRVRILFTAALAVSLLALPISARAHRLADETDADDKLQVVKVVITANSSEEPTIDNPLGPSQRNFRGKLEQLREIAADPDVAGIRLVIKGIPGYAKTLDMLTELRGIQAAGKKVICYAETISQSDAMISTMADLLVIPPTGMIMLEGLTIELMYLKDMFSKLDVAFEVLHVGDFKTAFEDFAKDEMSDGQRKTLESILDELYGQLVGTMAHNRGISKMVVEGLFSQLIVSPKSALEAGLLDAVAYESEFDDMAEELIGGEFEYVSDYGDRSKEDVEAMLENPFAIFKLLPSILNPPSVELPEEPYVAIVYASGAINSGKSQSDFQGKVTSMGSDTIVEALEETLDDDNCKAVVLRVNSPGGSAMASDMIWNAVKRVRAAGKPVVSSMGSVAASGGYYISTGCTKIVAQPSTITGSIGVVSMLPDFSKAVAELGINVQTVSRGPLGDELSLLKHGPSEVLKKTLTTWMLEVYEDFTGKVAEGRGLEIDRVKELAQGRVWTGREAEAVGLVDELGGLTDAIELACALGGISSATAPVVEYPEVPNFLEQMEEAMQGGVQLRHPAEELLISLGYGDLVSTVRSVLSDPRPLHAGRVQAVLPFQMVIR